MKTYEDVAFEYAKSRGLDDWQTFDEPWEYEEIAKLYANAKLDEAAEKATIWVETPINGTEFKEIKENLGCQTDPFIQTYTVFKDSILSLKDQI